MLSSPTEGRRLFHRDALFADRRDTLVSPSVARGGVRSETFVSPTVGWGVLYAPRAAQPSLWIGLNDYLFESGINRLPRFQGTPVKNHPPRFFTATPSGKRRVLVNNWRPKTVALFPKTALFWAPNNSPQRVTHLPGSRLCPAREQIDETGSVAPIFGLIVLPKPCSGSLCRVALESYDIFRVS